MSRPAARFVHRSAVQEGERYGRLVVGSFAGKDQRGRFQWNCRCDCGAEKVVAGFTMTSAGVRSCGCLQREAAARLCRAKRTHGLSRTQAVNVWRKMIGRCYDPNVKSFGDYGGRGISVCPEWRDDLKAFVLWAEAAGIAPGLTIERIDNDAGYSPENCRWASRLDQAHNKRNNVKISWMGMVKCATEWEREFSIPRKTIIRMARANMDGLRMAA